MDPEGNGATVSRITVSVSYARLLIQECQATIRRNTE